MPDSLRRRPEPIYRSALILGQGLFGFWRLRRIETGLDNLPDGGGAVLAMTHFGYLEFALVEWATWRHNRRRIRFLARSRLRPCVSSRAQSSPPPPPGSPTRPYRSRM